MLKKSDSSRRTAGRRASASSEEQRQKVYYKSFSSSELQALCDKYFDHCDEEGRKYTFPGLALWIGVTPETLDKWALMDGSDEQRAKGTVIKKAQARLSDALQQRTDSMAIFSLKQRCYGGYSEDGGRDKGGAVQVNVTFGQTSDAKVAVKYGE